MFIYSRMVLIKLGKFAWFLSFLISHPRHSLFALSLLSLLAFFSEPAFSGLAFWLLLILLILAVRCWLVARFLGRWWIVSGLVKCVDIRLLSIDINRWCNTNEQVLLVELIDGFDSHILEEFLVSLHIQQFLQLAISQSFSRGDFEERLHMGQIRHKS